jgi:hypothetical protein
MRATSTQGADVILLKSIGDAPAIGAAMTRQLLNRVPLARGEFRHLGVLPSSPTSPAIHGDAIGIRHIPASVSDTVPASTGSPSRTDACSGPLQMGCAPMVHSSGETLFAVRVELRRLLASSRELIDRLEHATERAFAATLTVVLGAASRLHPVATITGQLGVRVAPLAPPFTPVRRERCCGLVDSAPRARARLGRLILHAESPFGVPRLRSAQLAEASLTAILPVEADDNGLAIPTTAEAFDQYDIPDQMLYAIERRVITSDSSGKALPVTSNNSPAS